MKKRLAWAALTAALVLLCACARVQRPEASSLPADPTVSERVSGTDAPAEQTTAGQAASAQASTETVEETEAPYVPRTFTEADFHIYLYGSSQPEAGKLNIAFMPDNRLAGKPDPSIRVWDSWQLRHPEEIRAVCRRILDDPLYDPELYGRSLESMVTEWQAHSDINAAYDNERTRHVDLDRADEGVSYLEFWRRAARALGVG